MKNLSVAQKAYLAVLLAVGSAWLALAIGVPIYEYGHGKSALTALLAHVADILKFAVFGIAMLAWVLQRTGILPTVQTNPALGSAMSPVSRLRNIVLWMVIALLLVFLFNLFQGTGVKGHSAQSVHPAPAQNADLMSMFINLFPILLIGVVWIFFVFRFQAKKNKDLGKS
jgi:hypothetical protein